MPRSMASRGARDGDRPAVEAHLAAGRPVDAEDGAGELGAAGADQARHAEDLAARAGTGRRAWSAWAVRPQAGDLEHRAAGRALGRHVERFQVAADHHADHGVVPDLAPRQFAHDAAVAQHHDPVGAVLDLVQAVRDEDHATPPALSSAITFSRRAVSEAVRLEVGSSMMTMRASSDSALAISTSWRWASDRSATGVSGLEVDAEPLQQRRAPCASSAVRSISFSGPPKHRFAADHHVGRHVEIVEEVELLVHEGDARRHGAGDRERGMLRAVDADRAFARLDDAAQDLHQGRLAGAVLADQRQQPRRARRARLTRSSARTPG